MLPRRYHHLSRAWEQNTFLPFLYQTRTIARHYATPSQNPSDDALDFAVEDNASRRSRPQKSSHPRYDRNGSTRELIDHIPFEGFKTNVNSDFEGSTITPGERKAFEGLFKLRKDNNRDGGKETEVKRPALQENEKKREHRGTTARRAEDAKGQSLDDIMESSRQDELKRASATPYPKGLQRLADEASHRSQRQPSQSIAIFKAGKGYKEAFDRDLEKAQTDAQVWDLLESRIFKRVAALNLDGLSDPKNPNKTRKNEDRDARRDAIPAGVRIVSDLEIFTQELSRMLTNAHGHLTTCYPHSPLPMAILPHLRSLGPTAFALGASTHLYNLHLRCLYARYLDLDGIVATLREMDETVYSFDDASEAVVRKALTHARLAAKRGVWGGAVREWWESRSMGRKVSRLVWWLKRIRERREEDALRRSRLQAEADMAEGREEGDGDVGVRFHTVA